MGVTTCFDTARLGFGPMEKAVPERVGAQCEGACLLLRTDIHTHTHSNSKSVSGSLVVL